MNPRQIFLQHVGQTSEAPLALHITKAQGTTMWDDTGTAYLDLIGGISVCNIGHSHPEVIEAIKEQADKFLHVMVYGELVQSPQTEYAKLITSHLPASLNSVFFTASGTEATEGAMKLAKRVTGRTEIIAFRNSYHGSTQGALSLMGSEYWQQAYRPLLPGIKHLDYNNLEDLKSITNATACLVAETIQSEAGVNKPGKEWMQALRARCTEVGALLVLDEIQCGFGRNGSLWAFTQFNIVPDILLLGKALGGGMPMGAFVADKKLMDFFTVNPVLGNINTFGGHPVCCAAGKKGMEILLRENWIADIPEKEALFKKLLSHKKIVQVNAAGLMIAVHFKDFDFNKKLIDILIIGEGKAFSLFTDWFLFAPQALRIVPPLSISLEEIRYACEYILEVLDAM